MTRTGIQMPGPLGAGPHPGLARAYLHVGMVAACNFFASCACLGTLVFLSHQQILHQETIKFLVTVAHVYCFSLALIGPLQFVLHAYLSDALYELRPELLSPALRGALGLHAGLAVPLGLLFFLGCGFEAAEAIAAAIFFGLVVCIFVASIFLLVCLAYAYVLASFAGSMVFALVASWFLGVSYGYPGLLMGALAGHTLLLVLLYGRLIREMPASGHASLSWLAYARSNPWLVVAGSMLNLAPWVDKLVFWWGPDGYQVQGWMRAHEIYDTSLYLALLTGLPAYAHFLLGFETRFHRLYRDFCAQVAGAATHARIAMTRDEMASTLRHEVRQRAKLHGAILLAVFYLAPGVLASVGLPTAYAHVLRVAALGVAVGVEVLIHVVLLLYTDRQKEAAAVAAFYALSNLLFSAATTTLDLRFHGYGYFAAGLLSLILGSWLLSRRLSNLDYLVLRAWAIRTRSSDPGEAVA